MLWVLLGVAGLLVVALIVIYNGLVRSKIRVDEAEKLGYTGESVMGVAPELVSLWGNTMVQFGLDERFKQGLLSQNGLLVIDVPSLVDSHVEAYEERKAAASALGVDLSEASKRGLDLDKATRDGIRIAAGFFDRCPKRIIGVSISLILEILESKEREEEYVLYPDGKTPVPINLG